MSRSGMLAALGVLASAGPAHAIPARATRTYECQHPVMTGVEVYGLRHVSRARACRVALALFAWETPQHARRLYGCRPPSPAPGYPYLKLRRFDGWRLSLHGRPYGELMMSRGSSSFLVSGTDFPLNCT